ncbi:MAG: hypothetical protein ACOC0N_12255 [Chroococcales cyanobacterium]
MNEIYAKAQGYILKENFVNTSEAIAILTTADPKLGKLIQEVGECRLTQSVRQTELVPEIAKAIISQQISPKAATTIYSRGEV